MPTYTIIVKNKSKANQQYLLFSAPPAKSDKLGQVWSNVWVKTDGTPTPNGSQSIVITQDVFAICGQSKEGLATGVFVRETDYAGPASLTSDTKKGTMYTMDIVSKNPAFAQAPYGTTSKANSFAIDVSSFDPDSYPNIQVGMGKYNDAGEVVPAFVFTPDPTTTYDLTPQVTYYIATGDYNPGQVLDITSYGSKVEIDFTTAPAGWTKATVTQESDGKYSGPVFSAPSGQKGE